MNSERFMPTKKAFAFGGVSAGLALLGAAALESFRSEDSLFTNNLDKQSDYTSSILTDNTREGHLISEGLSNVDSSLEVEPTPRAPKCGCSGVEHINH